MLLEETPQGAECLLVILFHLHDFIEIVELGLEVLTSQLLLTIEGDCQGTDSDMGGLVWQEFRLDQGDIEQVTRIDKDALLGDVNSSAIVLQEGL